MFLSPSAPNFEPPSTCPGILLLALLSLNSAPSVLKFHLHSRWGFACSAEQA